MAILGDAWVVIRALTTGLNKDIKRGLDASARDVERAGDEQGASFGEHLGEGAENELKRGFGKRIGDTIRKQTDKIDDDLGKKLGKKLVGAFAGVLTSTLSAAAGLTQMLGMVTLLGGGIGALVGAIGALVGGLFAVGAAAAPAAVALGVVAAGAVTALLQAVVIGKGIFGQLSGDIETLTPAARGVREAFDSLKASFKEVFAEVSDGPFEALRTAITDITDGGLFDVLRDGIASTADAFTAIIEQADSLIKNPLFQSNLATILQTNSGLIESLGTGFVNLGGAFASVLAAAKPLIDRFAQWFGRFSDYIVKLTTTAQQTGRLTAFFERAGDVAAQIGGIFRDLGGILYDLGQAAGPLGTLLLGNFGRAASALNDFLDTDVGRAQLATFFAPNGPMHANLTAISGLIQSVGGVLVDLVQNTGVARLGDALSRAVEPVGRVLGTLVQGVATIGETLADGLTNALGTRGVKSLQDGLSAFAESFAPLAGAIGPLLGIVGDLARNLSNLLGPAFGLIAKILPQLAGPLDDLEGSLGGVLLQALQTVLPYIPRFAQFLADLAGAIAQRLGPELDAVGPLIDAFLSVLEELLPLVETLTPVIELFGGAFSPLQSIGDATDGLNMFADTLGPLNNVLGTSIDGFNNLSGNMIAYGKPVNDAADATDQLTQALDPLAQAQQRVSDAQDLYLTLAEKYGVNSDQARAAQDRLTQAQEQAEEQQNRLNDASETATDKIQSQIQAVYDLQNAELGRSNTQLDVESSSISLARAQENLQAVLADPDHTTLDARQAQLDLDQAQNRLITSAQTAAQAIGNAAIGNKEYGDAAGQAAANITLQRDYLQGLADQAEGPTRDALLQLIAGLDQVSATTVTPPVVDINAGPFNGKLNTINQNLTDLDRKKAEAEAALNDQVSGPIGGVNNKLMNIVKVFNATVTVSDAASSKLDQIKRNLDGLRDKTVTVTTKTVATGPSGKAGGGLINSDAFTTVGEEGRELVFLSRGQYVATYHKAQQILAAAALQSSNAGRAATTTGAGVPVLAGGGARSITVPITVNPSAGMNELELARSTGRTFAFEFRNLS